MMNILDLQDKLKNLSQEQLIQEMQAPSGELPQFLVLGEITRRQKMRSAFEGQQGEDQTTVAEDAVAAAGVPAGFAGQMAGAMAPQTDMEGNTAAMPQAPMMPEEPAQVPGMAGGGIVALRDGGRPGSPGTFVRDGMVYIVNERGEEIPWAPASQVSGMDMPAAPPAPASVRANPSFTEDRSPRSALTASREPAGPFDPMLGGVPPTMPMPLDPAMMPDVGGISSAPSVPSLMEERMGIGPAARDTPASISGAPAVAGEFQGPPMAPPARDPAQAELDALIAGAPPTGGARPFDRLFAGIGEGARAVVDNFRAPEGGYDFDPNLGYMMGAEPPVTEDTVAPTDPQAVAEAEALAAAQAAAAQPGGIAGAPSGGGGIASVAGAAGTAPTDFEQELLSMLAAREKRAEQDKWLALAQFGLQLMSSDAGTLGGAIGEAGGPALDALRSSRETAEGDRLGLLTALEQHRMGQAQLALSQQAAAARAAAGRGGAPQMPDPTAFGMSTDENRQMEVFLRMAESAEPATQLAGQQGVDELVRRIQMRSNMPMGGTGAVAAPSARGG